MKKGISAVIILMALVIAVVPFFTDCQSQGRSLTTKDGKSVPMKCHWTGIAEAGVALPLALTGILNLRKQRKETTRSLAVFGMAAGALAILFPTALIGVCANPDMICNLVMRPTLIAAGTLSLVASGVMFLNARDPRMQFSEVAA